MAETNEQLLAKAHSLKTHLGKMLKAHHSFHAAMQKAFSAHHSDMVKAFGHLHKLVGIEPGEQTEYGATGGEPQGVSPEAQGTKNLQDFGSGEGSDVGKGAKAGNMTKTEVQTMLTENNKTVEQMFTSFTETLLKAMAGTEEVIQDNGESPTFQKASGVGDRNQMRQPVQQVVAKTDAVQPQQTQNNFLTLPEAERQALMQKALQGDPEARKAVMGSALPQEVPNTLIAPLSKIH